MKQLFLLAIIIAMSAFSTRGSHAAVAKCTVLDSRGQQMIISCSQQAGTFPNGTPIKIKTDRPTNATAPQPLKSPAKPDDVIKRF